MSNEWNRRDILINKKVAFDYIGEALPGNTLSLIDDIIDGEFYKYIGKKMEVSD